MLAPAPETTTEPPSNADDPTNVPDDAADQMPPSVYVPAATGTFTSEPVFVPVEPEDQVV